MADIKSSKQVEVAYMKMQERDRLIEEQGEQRGIAIGEQRASDRINALITKLFEEKRMEDLKRAAKDAEYQKQLLKEYGL